MEETGVISRIEDDVVTVGCATESCQSCSSSFCSSERRIFEAANPEGLELRIGDVVDIYMSPGKTVAAGFMVLIVPLILFALAYFISGRLVENIGEGMQALSGLVGLASGFGISFLYGRRRRTGDLPRVLRIRENPSRNQTGDSLTPVG